MYTTGYTQYTAYRNQSKNGKNHGEGKKTGLLSLPELDTIWFD